MKKLMSIILTYAFLFNTVASAGNHIPQIQGELGNVMQKYDYMLTAHPNASDEDFRQQALQGLKKDVQKIAEDKTRPELQKEMNSIIEKIPSEQKQEEYRAVIENSTKDELNAMLANPELLNEAFRGTGSNYTGNLGHDILLYGGITLIVVALAVAISSESGYDYYYSREVGYNMSAYDHSCYDAREPYGTHELEEEARQKCLRRAERPNTCEYSHRDIDEEYGYYDCSIQIVYRAEER